MGAIVHVYVDDETLARLQRASDQDGRPIEELAECAVSEAALSWAKACEPSSLQKELRLG